MAKFDACNVVPYVVRELQDGDSGWTTKEALVPTAARDALINVNAPVSQEHTAAYPVRVWRKGRGLYADVSGVHRTYRWPRRDLRTFRFVRLTGLEGQRC